MSFSHSVTDEGGSRDHHSGGGSDFGDDEATQVRKTYEMRFRKMKMKLKSCEEEMSHHDEVIT
jgi:hypothetical protein